MSKINLLKIIIIGESVWKIIYMLNWEGIKICVIFWEDGFSLIATVKIQNLLFLTVLEIYFSDIQSNLF